VGGALHGPWADVESRCGTGDVEVIDEAEHDDRPLLRGEIAEGGQQWQPVLELAVGVVGRRLGKSGVLATGELVARGRLAAAGCTRSVEVAANRMRRR
jgi:hypothetical protein